LLLKDIASRIGTVLEIAALSWGGMHQMGPEPGRMHAGLVQDDQAVYLAEL